MHRLLVNADTHRRSELQQVLDPRQDVLDEGVHVFTVDTEHKRRQQTSECYTAGETRHIFVMQDPEV